jgi:transcriptional regulator with XRE-family HTH domain
MIGYTLHLQQRNRQADKRKLGVRLGRYCIRQGVPVAQVVELLGVSRQAVYNWFAGVNEPGPTHRRLIEQNFPGL